MIHDLNNALSLVTGYSELILDQMGHDSPHSEMLAQVLAAGERAAALTRQVRLRLREASVTSTAAVS